MKKDSKMITFNTSFEGKLDKKIEYEAFLFQSNGRLLDRKKVSDDKFSMSIDTDSIKGSRLFLAPAKPDREDKVPTMEQLIKQRAHEPVLPQKITDHITLSPIPEIIWKRWPWCRCHVTVKVWNTHCHTNSPVPNARIHVCEVDNILYWITRLPDSEIIRIREDIKDVLIPIPIPDPGPDPGPIETERFHSKAAPAAAARKVALNVPNADLIQSVKENLSSHNFTQLYSADVSAVRSYLIDNISYYRPLFCYFRWWWLRCDEIGTITSDIHGNAELDFWYWCSDRPDLYFWIEYNINGVWETVYNPTIGCHTWWNFSCGSVVNLYVNDSRIPCTDEPTIPGKAVVIATIGRRVSVNQIPQTGGDNTRGLSPSHAPFGGQLEPRVLFGDTLGSGNYYYRWSYRREGETDLQWKRLNAAVGKHYWVQIPDGMGGWTPSFPVHNLGPHNIGSEPEIFEVPKVLGPGGSAWAVVDERFDLATAFFHTNNLNNNDVALAAGFYELKFELFDSSGNLVDFTADGIDLKVVDDSINAPFGNTPLTTVTPPLINQIRDGVHLWGYKLLIRVDNQPTTASMTPVTSDGTGTCGADAACGFIPYLSANSPTHIQYVAHHPNNFATFYYNIHRGTSGTIHGASGNLLDPTPSIGTSGAAPISGVTQNAATDQFTYDLRAGDLLGTCTKAAFGSWLSVYATANDGYGRLGYDSSAAQAFALIGQGDCAE